MEHKTTFKLTTDNGTSYLPDPAGHMLIFINGILQPPGSTNAFTAFSDNIQFTEAPELGASFTGFYIGKLRQLDDISFEFDSLRQSFNLKRNDVFYSLTLTDGNLVLSTCQKITSLFLSMVLFKNLELVLKLLVLELSSQKFLDLDLHLLLSLMLDLRRTLMLMKLFLQSKQVILLILRVRLVIVRSRLLNLQIRYYI